MKTHLLLITALLVCTKLLSQNIIYSDNFDDNKGNWSVKTTNEIIANISNGCYNISHMEDQNYWCFYKSIFVEPTKNFRIESSIKQVKGVQDNGYGLMWGTRDASNFYCFLLASDGHYKIYESNKGQFTILVGWTKSNLINKMGIFNKLAVEREADELSFYLDDKKLYSCQFKPFKGSYIGFQVNHRMDISVDNLIVKQEKSIINVIPNWETGNKPENLGTNVNSIYPDKMPVISPDGLTLWLTRDEDPANIGLDDIWFSKFANGIWQKAERLGKPLNDAGYNFVFAVSPDNNSLYVGNVYNSRGEVEKEGMSIAHRIANNWTIPVELKIKNYYNRNKYVEVCLSSDQKTMLMTLERDDSYGIRDIYVSFLLNDGTWSEPKNIGNVVNTIEDETSPFLAADGESLYYSTSGKPGYGSSDIFLSRRLDSTWTKWSEPQNLGPEINTPEWDAYYSLPASGEYAYFASIHQSIGKLDIFRIKLPKSAKPKPVVLIRGKVLNSKTNEPIEANISYFDIQKSTEIGIARSNSQDGTYKIVLPAGTNYSMTATKEKFISISQNMDLLDSLTEYREVEKNLLMMPIEVGNIARLNNVFFDYNLWDLKDESKWELNRMVKLLNENPSIQIEIAGHTDNKGDNAYNLKLSVNRAKAVGNYLIANGIEKSRIVTNGYGKTKPVATNETEEGRQENRRVEFVIMKK